MWVAGREYGDMPKLLSPSVYMTYAGEDDSSPLGLDTRVLSLLNDSIALNSTAELRPADSAPPLLTHLPWCQCFLLLYNFQFLEI